MPRGGCYYCERLFTKLLVGEVSGDRPVLRTKDHIIPKSKGGLNSHKNMVPCCDKCNRLKADKMPEEFLIFLNSGINKHSYHGYKKDIFLLIINNTIKLIDKINGYKNELSSVHHKPVSETIKKVVEVIKASPASKTQEMNQTIFVKKFASTYPYIYEMLINTNPDLPRWIYDNAIKLATIQ